MDTIDYRNQAFELYDTDMEKAKGPQEQNALSRVLHWGVPWRSSG